MRQRWGQIYDLFCFIILSLVKSIILYDFEVTFDTRQKWSQMHKPFAVPLTFEKWIVKYENDTISREESKNAMNSVISAVQTLVSKLLRNSATINNICDDEELEEERTCIENLS